MTNDPAIPEIVQGRFPLPEHLFPAGHAFWLTLYLNGAAEAYSNARPLLQSAGWQNLDEESAFCGFAYPKRLLPNSIAHIREALATALEICNANSMTILEIDADTAFEPEQSVFLALYQAEDCP